MTAGEREPSMLRLVVVVLGLGLTSIIGWGTSFAMMSVLGSRMSADLGLSREAVFGGITVMLIASGLAAPSCGRLLDAEGPRRVMTFGTVLMAVALSLMARANGVVSLWATWALFGVAVPLAMSNASVTAIAHIAGPHARRGITGLTILGGLTSFFFLPITGWLEVRYGWRGTLAIFALLHLAVCLPIHFTIFPKRFTLTPAAPISNGTKTTSDLPQDVALNGVLPEHARRRAFWLIVLWSCCEGMLVWGVNIQAIDLLKGFGLTAETAIAMWMFSSMSQACVRVVDFAFGQRIPSIVTALISAVMAPAGFLLFQGLGASTLTAGIMAVCYGLGHGLFVIARNMLPLRLFGMKGLGETMGRLSLPQNIVNAAAPMLFAAILSRYGPEVALWSAVICALASLAAVIFLYLDLRAAPSSSG